MKLKISCNSEIKLDKVTTVSKVTCKVLDYKVIGDTLKGNIKVVGNYVKDDINKQFEFEDLIPFTVVFKNKYFKIDKINIENFKFYEVFNSGIEIDFDIIVNYTPTTDNNKDDEQEDFINNEEEMADIEMDDSELFEEETKETDDLIDNEDNMESNDIEDDDELFEEETKETDDLIDNEDNMESNDIEDDDELFEEETKETGDFDTEEDTIDNEEIEVIESKEDSDEIIEKQTDDNLDENDFKEKIEEEYSNKLEEILNGRSDNFLEEEEDQEVSEDIVDRVVESNVLVKNTEKESNIRVLPNLGNKSSSIKIYYANNDSDLERVSKTEHLSIEKVLKNTLKDNGDSKRIIIK